MKCNQFNFFILYNIAQHHLHSIINHSIMSSSNLIFSLNQEIVNVILITVCVKWHSQSWPVFNRNI